MKGGITVRKIGILIVLLLVAGLGFVLLPGCGQKNGQVSTIAEENSNPGKAERLTKFNFLVDTISDESSALTAVQAFNEYVSSRLTVNFKLGAEWLGKIADREAQLRRIKRGLPVRGFQIDCPQEEIDLAKMVRISSQGQTLDYRTALIRTRDKCREALPALKVYPDERMSPLEALVVSYVFFTGDDGSADENSIDLKVTTKEIQSFVEQLVT